MSNVIYNLLKQAESSEIDGYGAQFAFVDLPEGRLCVTIQHYKGGDGQQKKANSRVSWVYCGKNISRSDLEIKFAA